MTDLDTTAETTKHVAKELGKIVAVSAAETAAAYVGAVVLLAGVGFVIQKRDERKAKKAAAVQE